MLSRLAQQFAAEIRQHDWSDAPYRGDRAGHRREHDTNRGAKQLSPAEAETVKLNAIWVSAQVLAFNDPNFDIVEFARACDNDTKPGILKAGLRGGQGIYQVPGTYSYEASPDLEDPDNRIVDNTTGRMRVVMQLDDKTTWADLRAFVAKADEDDLETLWFTYDEQWDRIDGIQAHLRAT